MFWKTMLYVYLASVVIYWLGVLFYRIQLKSYKAKNHVKSASTASAFSNWAYLVLCSIIPIFNGLFGMYSFFCYKEINASGKWIDE